MEECLSSYARATLCELHSRSLLTVAWLSKLLECCFCWEVPFIFSSFSCRPPPPHHSAFSCLALLYLRGGFSPDYFFFFFNLLHVCSELWSGQALTAPCFLTAESLVCSVLQSVEPFGFLTLWVLVSPVLLVSACCWSWHHQPPLNRSLSFQRPFTDLLCNLG